MQEKLGLSFHRTFALSRDTLRQIVETAVRYPELTFGNIREDTTLGTIQVQSARRYAIGVGLLDEHEALPLFGKLAYQHNPGLSSVSTQWIMHYHMVAPHRSGPAFWNHLVLNCLRPGDTLTSQSLAHEIGQFIEQDEGRQIEMDTLKKTATAFLGTYSKADALGSLGLLEPTEDKKAYQVAEPASLDAAVFAYALADYWQSIWQNRNG